MARVVYVVSKLGIACILLYFMGANWYGPALGAILAPLVVLPVVSLQVLKHLDRTEGRAELPIRQIWRFGSPLIGWYAANQILNVSDRFFIEGFLSTDQVGIYSVNYALAASLIAAVMQPLLQAAYPVLVRSSAASSGSVAPQMGKLLLLVLCVLPPVVVLLTVFGPSFVRLVSDTPYVASRWVLATLALGVSCWHVALFLQKLMEIDGATAKLFGHIAFAALLNIVANVLLIPVFGILGAAVGTLAAYLVYLFKILPNPRSLWPDNSWRFVAGRVGVALLGLSATAWLVPKILPALGGGSWIVACVCSALSYVILLRRGGLSYRIIVQDGL
jgi:O-antigen/teichoic acid export membrane protein